MQGWGRVEDPYNFLIEELCEGKSEEERAQIIKEFDKSHTRKLIEEEGLFAPALYALNRIYCAEQRNGVRGFMKQLLTDIPTFLDILDYLKED